MTRVGSPFARSVSATTLPVCPVTPATAYMPDIIPRSALSLDSRRAGTAEVAYDMPTYQAKNPANPRRWASPGRWASGGMRSWSTFAASPATAAHDKANIHGRIHRGNRRISRTTATSQHALDAIIMVMCPTVSGARNAGVPLTMTAGKRPVPANPSPVSTSAHHEPPRGRSRVEAMRAPPCASRRPGRMKPIRFHASACEDPMAPSSLTAFVNWL